MTSDISGNLLIRLANMLDLHALSDATFSSGTPDKVQRRLALQAQGHLEYPIAIIGEQLVGYLLLKWNGPEDPFLKRKLPPCAEIEDFAVAVEHRGYGIGSALLAYAEDRAREHGDTRLGLSAGIGNEDARRLYERLGFVTMPESEHRVSWFEPVGDGTSRIASEACVYMMKDLG
jgi:ribosomal protein S18 acetylase RimI-like enzyme